MSLPNATGNDENLSGTNTGGRSEYSRYENGLGWTGQKTDPKSVIGEYTERAYEGIQSGRYPAGMEDVIKEYFSSF